MRRGLADAPARLALCLALFSARVALAAPVPPAAVDLQYVQNSGWIVSTPRHVLVFDYVERILPGEEVPAAARLQLDEIGDRHLVVFVSHGHADHFSPAIAEWARKRPDTRYVVGWPDSKLPGSVHTMKPREEWAADGLEVWTTDSTDEGVGFLVRVDGLTLYHAGDHAQWAEDSTKDFQAEIQWLQAKRFPIDLAFFAIATGFACEPRASMWEGIRFAALALQPRVLIPMHVRCPDKLDLYQQFRAKLGSGLGATAVVAPTHRGQRFQYQAGKLTPKTPE